MESALYLETCTYIHTHTHTHVHINIHFTSIYVSSVAFETMAQTLKYSLSMSSYNLKNYNIYDSLSKLLVIF